MMTSIKRKRHEAGSSIVEVALMSPWIFFLFVGLFDLGFYTYGGICVQNAARAAAIQTATNAGAFYQSDALACTAALSELSLMPNVGVATTTCTSLPVIVTRRTLCDSAKVTYVSCDAAGPADGASNNTAASSIITVQYQSIPLVPIPLIIPARMTITRTAEARIINE